MNFWRYFTTFCFFILLSGVSLAAKPNLKSLVKRELAPIARIKKQSLEFEKSKRIKSTSFLVKHYGELSILRPESVSWSIVRPGSSSVTITEDELFISGTGPTGIIDRQKLSLNDSKVKEGATEILELKAWLSLDLKTIIKAYRVKRFGKGKYGFFPKKGTKAAFDKVFVEVIPGERLKTLAFYDKSGDRTQFSFKEKL